MPLRRILLVALTLLAVAFPAGAAERFALIIGNANYQSRALPALNNPLNDAALMSATLKKAGFVVDLVMDADLRTMKRAVSAFAARLARSDDQSLAFVYYSGHGFQANNLNYLAPLGADLKDEIDAEFEAMSVDWVLAKLEAAHGGSNVVVLDACRNMALSRGTGEGLALMARTPVGSFISYATAPGSTAADGSGLNSPYTSAVARELLRPGMTIEAAFKNVRRDVVRATGGRQVPWDYSSLTRDIVLVPDGTAARDTPQAAGTPETLVELQLWNNAKEQASSAAFLSYLDRYPKGVFAALAREELATLAATGEVASFQMLFARLTSRGLIVDNPTRPHEFYANARMHELQGDYVRARQDYLKFFAFDLDKVDPHYRFQNLLTVQEGRAGARRTYSGLSSGLSDPTARFAALLLLERELRVAALEAFIAEHPRFAPALHALARDYSPAVLGQPSLADKTREESLLKRFIGLVEQGHFLRHFYDQQLAAQHLAEAGERLAALSVIAPAAKKNPVNLGAMRTNQGWQVQIYIADTPTEIFVEHPGRPVRSTGFLSGAMSPQTGQPLPFPSFPLPGAAGPMDVKVSYLDARGTRHGPFAVRFDPATALVRDFKERLLRTPGGWISFRDWDGKRLLYYSLIASYTCAVEGLSVGIDRQKPDRPIALGPCDPDDPHRNTTDNPYFTLPPNTRFVTVQIDFRDGTRSDVVEFPAR